MALAGDEEFCVGLGVGEASPNPGGSRDSGLSWAIAGMATASPAAAVSSSLVRVRIATDIDLNLLGRHLMGAA